MAFSQSWPDFTDDEVRRTIERDFDSSEIETVIEYLSSWDSAYLQMVILFKVQGRHDLIPQYEKWDWKDLLATTDGFQLEEFRPHRSV